MILHIVSAGDPWEPELFVFASKKAAKKKYDEAAKAGFAELAWLLEGESHFKRVVVDRVGFPAT